MGIHYGKYVFKQLQHLPLSSKDAYSNHKTSQCVSFIILYGCLDRTVSSVITLLQCMISLMKSLIWPLNSHYNFLSSLIFFINRFLNTCLKLLSFYLKEIIWTKRKTLNFRKLLPSISSQTCYLCIKILITVKEI